MSVFLTLSRFFRRLDDLVASPSVELIGIRFVSQMTESSSFSHILHHRACGRTYMGVKSH
jgi:hypothetical protein